MQQWIDLNTKMADDCFATMKQFGELNVKTMEAFFEQQKESAATLTETAKTNMKKFSAVKTGEAYIELQKELLQDSVTSTVSSWKNAVEVANTNTEAYRGIAEEVAQTAKTNMEQTATTVKAATTEAVAEVKKAVKATKK